MNDALPVPRFPDLADEELADLACDWVDFRNAYGIPALRLNNERAAFAAGWVEHRNRRTT